MDGSKLVTKSMDLVVQWIFYGRHQLLLTVDERHTEKKTGFDVLEALMKILPYSVKEKITSSSF